MKSKTLFNLLVGLTAVIVLFGGVLVVRRACAQSSEPAQGLPSAAKRAAPVPTCGENQLEPTDRQQFLAPLAYPGFAYEDCLIASFQLGALPFTESSTTAGGQDDYNLGTAGTCAGGGTQYLNTGLGDDVVYLIATDRTCTLGVSVDPTGSDDLALYVEHNDCFDVTGNCVIVNDAGGAGVQEDVQFQATAGEHYYIIVDGYNGDSGPYDLTISDVSATGCRLIDPSESELGDAPDSSNHDGVGMAAYPPGGLSGISARYPTVFDVSTGSPPGPKHWNPRGEAWLGSGVSVEIEADRLPDEDGEKNIDPAARLADRDGADDGLVFPVDLPHCGLTVITYTVTVTPSAQFSQYILNVWFDYNRDGDWEDAFDCGFSVPEWDVQDDPVVVGPGTHTLTTPNFVSYNPTPEKPLWMRITLSGQYAPTAAVASGADGRGPSGGYAYGETEDYYLCYLKGAYYPCNKVYLPLVLRNFQ